MSTSNRSGPYSTYHELAILLKAAAQLGLRLRFQTEDTAFQTAAGSAWEGYDAESAREAWRSVAGLLAVADADALIEQLKLDREQSSSECCSADERPQPQDPRPTA